MSRTVNAQDHAQKRNDILDAAQRLVFARGYERMTIQDILAELNISSGAFYHYFATKPAVLEALVERMLRAAEQPLLAIASDPSLSALEKLRSYFRTIDQMRRVHPETLTAIGRGWYSDDNAIVRQKVDDATGERRAALLSAIVQQGVREGAFTTAYPEQCGVLVVALLRAMADTHARLLLSLPGAPDPQPVVAAIVAAHTATMDAIERILGLPANSLDRTGLAAAQFWADAIREERKSTGMNTDEHG